MRIVRAEVLEYVRKLDGRSWNPVSRWTERRAPLLILETDEGVRGCGEAWSKQDEIGVVLAALARSLRTSVVGRSFPDGEAIRALRDTMPYEDWVGAAVLSAIDMALWDLLARSRQQPLWQALAGTADIGNAVDVYASGGLYRDGDNTDDLASEVARYRGEGFRNVKIKVGGMSLEDDVARIGAARDAIGSDGVLWVDAVNQLHAGNAIGFAQAWRLAGADAIQAPVAFEDHPAMARIGRAGIPVIAGEAAYAEQAFLGLLDAAHVALLQVNLGLCGGFTGASRIAALAASRGTPVTVQAHGTAVLLDASLHWGAASGVHSVEFHRFHDHLRAMFASTLGDIPAGAVELSSPTATHPIRPGQVPGESSAISLVVGIGSGRMLDRKTKTEP